MHAHSRGVWGAGVVFLVGPTDQVCVSYRVILFGMLVAMAQQRQAGPWAVLAG